MRITVMQVFRSLGIDSPNSSVSWSVGAQMAAQYRKEFGEYPPKNLHPKTSGAGSHCFAEYPSTWRTRIEAVIKDTIDYGRSQGDLFE